MAHHRRSRAAARALKVAERTAHHEAETILRVMGPLQAYGERRSWAVDACEMCGEPDNIEPAFNPDGEPKILCGPCRIGSAELLFDRLSKK